MDSARFLVSGIVIFLVSVLTGCASSASRCTEPLQRINAEREVPAAASTAGSRALEARP